MPDSSLAAHGLIPVINALPGPWSLVAVLLFITFVIHLVLMNAVVGVSIISLVPRLASLFSRQEDAPVPDAYAPDVLLPKGVAFIVNFGIPPFLFLQVLYGQYIYASSVIMALWWLSVMLVVMLAYYGLYINMARRGIQSKSRTIALALATLLLLWNAFLFVNNMTLMQSPERWAAYGANASGSFLNLADPQVFPRYLHIIAACLAVGGLCLAAPAHFMLRKDGLAAEDRANLESKKTRGMRWFIYASLAQVPLGLLFYISLPAAQRALFLGGGALHTALLLTGILLLAAALASAFKHKAPLAAICTGGIVAVMAGMRDLLRASMLEPYYAPQMRAMEYGPLLMFLGSIVVFAPLMLWAVRIYLRSDAPAASVPAHGLPHCSGQSEHGPATAVIYGPDEAVIMVNEIAHCILDDGEDEEKNGDNRVQDREGRPS